MFYEEDLGWWFPDGETHFQDWMRKKNQKIINGRFGYQYHKYEAVKKYITNFRKAIDVGSHVGLWAYPMSFDFGQVYCFEPITEHCVCWKANMENRDNAELFQMALGNENKEVSLRTREEGSSGGTGVEPEPKEGDFKCMMEKLDNFNFSDVDFIKCDCEGFELYVMQGAEETIKRCKPVICIEQKTESETGVESRYGIKHDAAITYLESLGMKKAGCLQGDYFMVW